MKDRNVKYPKKEAEGIPYYIMIDVDAEVVEVYQLKDGYYQRQPLDQNTPFAFSLSDCGFEMLFNQIWE